MSDIQTDLSDQALIHATRANLYDFFRHLAKSDPASYFENEAFIRWRSGIQHPWFNGVLAKRPPTQPDEAFIAEVINYFRSRHIHTFTWWINAPHPFADWKPILTQHGFHFSDDTPGMAIDLNELNTSTQKAPGLEIKEVQNEKSLKAWSNIFTRGYGLPADWESSVHRIWGQLGLGLPVRNYIAYLNGEPVATSCLFLGGGAAGIYSVSTLPEARGKGIGAAITLQPLLDAREMGYRIGTLQSSDMGFNIYKKLGFRHLCQIENFYLHIRQ